MTRISYFIRWTALAAVLSLSPALVSADPVKDRLEAEAFYKRAMVYYEQGAYKEAADYLKKAEKKDKTNLDYRFALAEVFIKLHKPDDALDRYEDVYKKDPTNARALAGMAAAYEEMQRYRDAVKMWSRYVKLPVAADVKATGEKRLAAARELFAANYEIAENPKGGAENLLAPDDEQKIGFQTAQQIAMDTPILFDPEVNAYVRDLCQRLVGAAKGFPSSYKLIVFDTAQINAFATPGYIGVNRGLLAAARNESELAGVLGHEIGHSVAHHVAKRITKSYKDQKAIEQMQKQDGKLAAVLAAVMGVGSHFSDLKFSRDEESQADRLGVHVAFDAGYDPKGLIGMFRTFESMAPSSRSWWDKINRTHPMSIDRINAVSEYIELLPARELKTDSPEFVKMQGRLKELPPPPDAKGILK